MSDTFQKEREQTFARQQLGAIFAAPERAYAIHYALQRLRRDQTHDAPPVAAIALRCVGTGRERVFSLKQEAEAAGLDIARPMEPARLVALEYSLLFKFYDFLETSRERLFVHWYMRDERFGFPALAARYRRVLAEISDALYGARSTAAAAPYGFSGTPPSFPVLLAEASRVDLAQTMLDIYGIGPVGLRELAQSNNLSLADMIEGVNEPAAFQQGNHAHLAWSSATKARLICELAALAWRGTLRPPRSRSTASRAGNATRLFINYRREDTEAVANRLHERLSIDFGEDNVFIDTDDLPAGIDFEAVLRSQIESCDVFLAIIGRGWAGAADAHGHKRLGSESDFVRKEIRAALARGIPVIPVLVEGAPLPTELELPADLLPLRRRMAVEVRSREFRQDAERLVLKIREAVKVGQQLPQSGWR